MEEEKEGGGTAEEEEEEKDEMKENGEGTEGRRNGRGAS